MTGGRLLVDAAIGETRTLLVQDGQPIALRLWRWSEVGRRARWGQVYVGRVTAVEPALRGAFVDLGLADETGFLPAVKGASPPVGAWVQVSIRREGARGKGPVLGLLPEPASGPARCLAQADADEALVTHTPATWDDREAIDAAQERVLAGIVNPTGGGLVTLEQTRALVAIDIDAGGRVGARDPERFALELNLSAGAAALGLIRLGGWGGLMVVDFLNLRRPESRAALETHMKTLAAKDPWGLQTSRLSRFGLMELQRAQLCRPVREVLVSQPVETAALAVLRRIERAAQSAKGRVVTALVSADIGAWLAADPIGWRPALEARIGLRWRLETDPMRPALSDDVSLV